MDDVSEMDMLHPEDFNGSDNEDTRSELKFDPVTESLEERKKRAKIEDALHSKQTTLSVWRKLAIEEYGLVNDDLRRQVWPLLLEVDPNGSEKVPSLRDLSDHAEYNQVVLDVNRSLKRFPPGIPYKQRLALQDQLTVLILRVIMKYPNLRYYQGYHDVAITFLLVVGEAVSFRIMERLSTDHLEECMEATMEKTSYRLNYIYPLIKRVDKQLHDRLDNAMLGTMFALPWYLTWFGHSLNQYRDVVRLYDFFLASDKLMPLYVAAALVLERKVEIFECDADMAMIHCLLSTIPDNLNFEHVLHRASEMYQSYPPEKVEKDVKKRVKEEADRRRQDELRARNRLNRKKHGWVNLYNYMPQWLMLHYRNKYGILFATATLVVAYLAYMKASEASSLWRSIWGS
ncbi:TBC1 domain family member 20 [Atheta coriaria]|uniref:TBC1 domain family member 20 n=1 Tax=Dalotia coriaria TaxID=877792 RepID=UPI0031F420C2